MSKITLNLKPDLYQKQKDAIFCLERYSFIEASTKSGKTLGCIEWLVTKACEQGNGANYWWIAPVFRQAKIAYYRIKNALLKFEKHGFQFKEGTLQVVFPNGAIISCLSGDDPDNLYGDDVRAAVIDEASRVKEESFFAVRSTLTATNGPLRCIGNVKGKGNWFYRLSRQAQNGSLRDSKYSILTAYDAVDAGVLKSEEIEDAKKLLPEAIFNELYLAIASDDGGNPFGLQHIKKNIISSLSDNPPVAFGLDLGKKQDYTVLTGLDKSGNVCHFERWQSSWEVTIEKVVEIVRGLPVSIDATSIGDPIIEWIRKTAVEKDIETSNIDAFIFSNPSKQRLIEEFVIAVQTGKIKYPNCELVNELELFEYELTKNNNIVYHAPVGSHDDCVCSAALAVRSYNSLGLIVHQEADELYQYFGSRESLETDFGIINTNIENDFFDSTDYDEDYSTGIGDLWVA